MKARLVYSALLYLLTPLYLLRLWLKGRKLPAYRERWLERLAFFPALSNKPVIWIHAVSVGEVNVASPLIEHCLTQYPASEILVTTTTPTGAALVEQKFTTRISHRYFPYDVPDVVARFLNKTRPQILIVLETELWPNCYAACAQRHIPILIVNARLSEKSLKGYLKLPNLIRETLNSVHHIHVQTPKDRDHYRQLGARDSQISVSGNIKFDLQLSPQDQQKAVAIRTSLNTPHCWIAGSTHEGEEIILLQAQQKVLAHYPEAILILVPRHPDRFNEVAELCHSTQMRLSRRSQATLQPNSQVYLADTLGELQALYGAADIAFVAGSLTGTGGHNPLEPAAFARPIISGEQVHNFQQLFDELAAADGVRFANTADDIAESITALFANADDRQNLGDNAYQYLQSNEGAAEITLAAIDSLIQP